MKYATFVVAASALADAAASAATEVTAITQGTAQSERVGNKISIHKIELRGATFENTNGIDVGVYLAKSTSAPVIADYTPAGYPGSFIKTEKFVPLLYQLTDSVQNVNTWISKRFWRPIIVQYNGATGTSGIRNRIYAQIKNDTGSAINAEYVIKVWFTDG
ncbi:hypothetical protein [Clavibacter sepedonicus]|uniref:hypothetical protein n=1 Tax=Clavibacter sepedonicus TaxID=31964 RepID=UPI003DA2B447